MKENNDVRSSLRASPDVMATVIRDSGVGKILATDLVPGDIVELSQVGRQHISCSYELVSSANIEVY